jgi:beta-lactam-binding protein with PASTA domain
MRNGSAGIPIPNFAGQSPESAKPVLEGLGFTYADGGQIDSPLPAGTIVSTDPAAGSPGAIGQTVTVYTSKGNQIQIPDAVSGASNYNDSKAILNGAGFGNVSQGCVVVTQPGDVGKPKAQSPGAGQYGTPNTPIRVSIGALTC